MVSIPNLGHLIAQAWEDTIRETPDPMQGNYTFNLMLGIPVPSYRERIDRQPINWMGELIPRIVTVRRNLRRLGNIRLDPKRLP